MKRTHTHTPRSKLKEDIECQYTYFLFLVSKGWWHLAKGQKWARREVERCCAPSCPELPPPGMSSAHSEGRILSLGAHSPRKSLTACLSQMYKCKSINTKRVLSHREFSSQHWHHTKYRLSGLMLFWPWEKLLS